MNKYKVVNEFNINDAHIITLDRPREAGDMGKKGISCDSSVYEYSPVHNDNMLAVHTSNSLSGKEILFCG